MTSRAPVADIAFALRHAARFAAAREAGVYDRDDETLDAVLEEAGKFATDVIAPRTLNRMVRRRRVRGRVRRRARKTPRARPFARTLLRTR